MQLAKQLNYNNKQRIKIAEQLECVMCAKTTDTKATQIEIIHLIKLKEINVLVRALLSKMLVNIRSIAFLIKKKTKEETSFFVGMIKIAFQKIQTATLQFG